jgi:hypothetical protein
VAPFGADGDPGRHLPEGDALGRHAVGDATGQRHDLLHEVDELLRLGVEVLEHLGACLGIEVGMAAQDGEVRAHARQRGAQLVTGVLDEAPLVVAGGGERGEHAVERIAQPGDLVLAGDRHLHVQPAGPLDVGGGPGEAHQRARDRRGDEPPEHGGGDGDAGDEQDRAVAQVVQHPSVLDQDAASIWNVPRGHGRRFRNRTYGRRRSTQVS